MSITTMDELFVERTQGSLLGRIFEERSDVERVVTASVMVCMCSMACWCSLVVSDADQSDGTNRLKSRILA